MGYKLQVSNLWTLLAGAALGVTAGLLLAPGIERVKGAVRSAIKAHHEGSAADKEEGTYCSVPEGADICFPDK